ncbi:helix-turn-helix domain-containing protein [Paenibacillus larvae]
MPEEMLTIPQLAARLQISERKAYELKQRKGFPFYKFGERQIRVIWSEVLEWTEKEKMESEGEHENE